MMNKIASYAHVLILAWVAFSFYSSYTTHIEAMDGYRAQTESLDAQIKIKENEKKLLTDYYKDIDAAKEKIESVAKEVEKLQQQLPDNIMDTENLQLFSSVAQGLNIKNIFLTPKDESDKGFYITKEYELKATGTFLQFLILFEKIGMNERLFNVESLKIEQTTEKQKGRFQLVNAEVILTAYKYNPNYKEDRGIQEIEQKFIKKANPNGQPSADGSGL